MARERLRWSRSGGQRLVLVVNSLVVLGLATGSVLLGYAAVKLSDVDRLDVAEALTAPTPPTVFAANEIEIITPEVVGGATTTTTEPAKPPGPAENFLIVGSDNAENIDPDDPLLNGREDAVGNNLADTIMVLRLEPETGQVHLLSIPRDLDVEIAGKDGRRLKINTAFNFTETREQRVARLIDTVELNLEIGIQHYVEVDLAAFQRVVDAVDGVQVCFEGPTRNPRTGLLIPSGGWHRLEGQMALNYVRSRAGIETQRIDGQWVGQSPRGDLDRIERQQEFVREAVDQVFADITGDPRTLLELLDIFADELVVSNTFSVVDDGRNLAAWFRGLDDEKLSTGSLDVVDLPRTASRTDLRLGMGPGADRQLDVFRGIGQDAVIPKRVTVSVRADDRAELVAGIADLGFVIGTEWAGSGEVDGVVIRYGIGGHNAANLLAAYLDFAVTFLADESVSGNTIVLEYGDEPPDVLASPRALTIAASALIPPVTTTPPVIGGDGAPTVTTTVPEREYEFDCDAPRPE